MDIYDIFKPHGYDPAAYRPRDEQPTLYDIAISAPKSSETDIEDYIVWPDDDYCLACELRDYSHKSDDYARVPYMSITWSQLHHIIEYA